MTRSGYTLRQLLALGFVEAIATLAVFVGTGCLIAAFFLSTQPGPNEPIRALMNALLGCIFVYGAATYVHIKLLRRWYCKDTAEPIPPRKILLTLSVSFSIVGFFAAMWATFGNLFIAAMRASSDAKLAEAGSQLQNTIGPSVIAFAVLMALAFGCVRLYAHLELKARNRGP